MSILTDRVHFVYHLAVKGIVVYVGRSISPKVRKTVFERKHSLRVEMNIYGPFDFERASKLEVEQIKELKPGFNIYISSSRCRLGMPAGYAQKLAVSNALKGKPKSPEHKASLWKNRGPLSQTPKNIKRREGRRICSTM